MNVGSHDPPVQSRIGGPVDLFSHLVCEHVVEEDGQLYASERRNSRHVGLVVANLFDVHQKTEGVGGDVLRDRATSIVRDSATKSRQVGAVSMPATGFVTVRLPGPQVGLPDALDRINRMLDISTDLDMSGEFLQSAVFVRWEVERDDLLLAPGVHGTYK